MRRVVITGLGMVSPLGNDVLSSWSALVAGEAGAAEIIAFDHTNYSVHFACELKGFDPTVWIDRKASRRMDRLRADDPRGCAAGRDRLGRRHREGARPLRGVDCDRHRRPAELSAVLPRAAHQGTGPRQSVLDPVDHPEHGRRLGVDRARHEGTADERVHRVRGVEYGDRRRDG